MANGIRITKISTYGHFHGSQKTARFEIENIIELWYIIPRIIKMRLDKLHSIYEQRNKNFDFVSG